VIAVGLRYLPHTVYYLGGYIISPDIIRKIMNHLTGESVTESLGIDVDDNDVPLNFCQLLSARERLCLEETDKERASKKQLLEYVTNILQDKDLKLVTAVLD
jgi:hypothetical protein